MITVRKRGERGKAEFGWLSSRHTFSFGEYHDPQHMGFSDLRVINEDKVQPAQGFGSHPHRDMEIISYVLDGALEHKDSLGTGSVIRPGEVQRMSAGTGIVHSEYNHSPEELVHFLQIWILPEKNGIEPGYEQKKFEEKDLQNQLHLVASRDGRDGSLTVHQDIKLYVGKIETGKKLKKDFEKNRKAWVQVARGKIDLNGQPLEAGDGATITDKKKIEITGLEKSEVLVFDLRE